MFSVGLIGFGHGVEQVFGQVAAGAGALAEVVDGLAAQDLDGLTDAALAEQTLALRRLADRLEGQWLQRLAAVDGRGAAGMTEGSRPPRPPAGSGPAPPGRRRRHQLRADRPGVVPRPGRHRRRGDQRRVLPAHAAVLAAGTHDLPHHTAAEAEPVLLDAARRLDPPRLRRVLGHLHQVADPDGADDQAERRRRQRGLWLAPTWEGMVALRDCWTEAGQTLAAALEPWPARPRSTPAAATSAAPMPWSSWPAATAEVGSPQTGGVRPGWLHRRGLDSLLGAPGRWVGRPAGPDP